MKIWEYVIPALIFIILSASGTSAEHSLQVTMILNNTGATLYIPGPGSVTAGSLTPATYTNPNHFYVCSYDSSSLTGLVHQLYNPRSITINKTINTYSMSINQSFNRSMVFAVFSKGDWRRIDNVINLIELGGFLERPTPTFGFGLGKLYDIEMYLKYDTIDFVGDRTVFNKGERMAIASNNGTVPGKASIIFRGF